MRGRVAESNETDVPGTFAKDNHQECCKAVSTPPESMQTDSGSASDVAVENESHSGKYRAIYFSCKSLLSFCSASSHVFFASFALASSLKEEASWPHSF
jgi:hypothetical protein